jgi:hypothetical protein
VRRFSSAQRSEFAHDNPWERGSLTATWLDLLVGRAGPLSSASPVSGVLQSTSRQLWISGMTQGRRSLTMVVMSTTPTQDARILELLVLNLFAVFSEFDPARRMKAIVANYTEDVIWSSPEATTRGYEELNEGAQKLLDRTPNFAFNAAGPVHVLRDLGYLAFTYGVPQQPPASIGYDVALVRNGRIAVLYTLLNGFTDQEQQH